MKPLPGVTRVVRSFLLIVFLIAAISVASALAQAGVPVPPDSPLYQAFTQLKSQSGYKMTMNMQMNDPRMAQMAAMGMGFSSPVKLVKGDTTQVTMHMKMPAMDVPGTIDDWEIRAVVRNGRGARLITSPAVPRYLKRADRTLDMQMAMLEKQAATAVAQAAAQGPLGWARAAVETGQLAQGLAETAMLRKKAHDFFSWQCLDQPVGQGDAKNGSDQLTDLKPVGDQAVEGKPATGYEFYVHNGDRVQGPIRLLVAKDSGLPLRIEMSDPRMNGSMHIDYDFNPPGEIEVPACLGGQ